MVGLTMIEAMTFEAAMECYNLESLEVVEGYFERKRKELSGSSYSSHICELALRCTDEDLLLPIFINLITLIYSSYLRANNSSYQLRQCCKH